MAVAFDASSESHSGTAGSTSAATFQWTHTPTGTPKGVLVYTFSNANASTADVVSQVQYGGWSMTPVSGGRAVDTASEPGDCKAWYLSGHGHDPSGTWAAAPTTLFGTNGNVLGIRYGNGTWTAVGTNSGVTTIVCAASPLGTWTAATPGTSLVLQAVAYGNGYWVAAGQSGAIRYATDPTGTWSAATSGTTASIGEVAYGNGYWVAIGSSGTVRYATDPTGTWSAATSPGFGTANVTSVAYGNGYWVAVAAGGAIRYTTDPTGTWSAATSGTTLALNSVAYGNGYWVAVGQGGTIRYASDPTGTWSAPSSAGAGTAGLNCVAYGNGLWVTSGGNNVSVRVASDPTGTWGGSAVPMYGASSTTIYAMAYGEGYWMAGGASSSMRVAADFPLPLPTGAQTVIARRSSTTDECYGVAITVTADYETEVTGVVLKQEDQALAATAVDDGSPGTKSMRFAGVNSGLAAPPTVNSGTTAVADIDYGTRVVAVARETSASEGSTSIGWTASSDDVAAVYLAIREAIVPWTVGVPIR